VPEIEGKMNEWQYARLHKNWVDIGSSTCKVTLFQNGGRIEIGSDDENDAWKMFDSKLCELGRDGWELVGVAPLAGGYGTARTTAWHLWFKRPLGDRKQTQADGNLLASVDI
jgi:hypothetical protein